MDKSEFFGATGDDLAKLKEKYLDAHTEYDRCVAALAHAGLKSAASLPEETLNRLARAFADLQVARNAYRAALFHVAFDAEEPLS
jgi:hypothetical protein